MRGKSRESILRVRFRLSPMKWRPIYMNVRLRYTKWNFWEIRRSDLLGRTQQCLQGVRLTLAWKHFIAWAGALFSKLQILSMTKMGRIACSS